MGVGHGHSENGFEAPRGVRRIVLLILAPLIGLTLAGIVLYWPSGQELPTIAIGDFVRGSVVSLEPCGNGDESCAVATITVEEGPDSGQTVDVTLTVGPVTPDLSPGTAVYLQPLEDPSVGQGYALADVDRTKPLIILTVLFAGAVVLLARWKGVAALVGLVASLLILAVFVLPALLQGSPPVVVAALGAGAIAIVSMGLAHGVNERTGVALIGTLAALLLTTLLGYAATEAMNFTGLATEEAAYLAAVSGGELDLQGLLLAGLVIGALGVLDDVTVTQAASAWEVFRADRRIGVRDLWASGMRVGKDHVAAVVNTLVLAYVGAALPLFLLLTMSDAPLLQSINSEVVAAELVRSMVGGLGIVAAVPITTALAAALLVDGRRRELAASRYIRP